MVLPLGNMQSISKKGLLPLWLHLTFQQSEEVGISIISPVTILDSIVYQATSITGWETEGGRHVQNHTQNPGLRWNQRPGPQIPAEGLILNTTLLL